MFNKFKEVKLGDYLPEITQNAKIAIGGVILSISVLSSALLYQNHSQNNEMMLSQKAGISHLQVYEQGKHIYEQILEQQNNIEEITEEIVNLEQTIEERNKEISYYESQMENMLNLSYENPNLYKNITENIDFKEYKHNVDNLSSKNEMSLEEQQKLYEQIKKLKENIEKQKVFLEKISKNKDRILEKFETATSTQSTKKSDIEVVDIENDFNGYTTNINLEKKSVKVVNNNPEIHQNVIEKESKKLNEDPFNKIMDIDERHFKNILLGKISKDDKKFIDTLVDIAINKMSKYSGGKEISEILGLKSTKRGIEAAKSIILDSIIHLKLSNANDKSHLFEDNNSNIHNIMVRAIFLAAIAERETGAFNYSEHIFSMTKAFGKFQVNGNTLGYNVKNIMKILDTNVEGLKNNSYDLSISDISKSQVENYKNWSKKHYYSSIGSKENKQSNKKLNRIENKIVHNLAKTIMERNGDTFDKDQKVEKYEKIMAKHLKNGNKKSYRYYQNKLDNYKEGKIDKYVSLIRRTAYGIETNMPSELRDNKDFADRRLEILELSASLIEVYNNSQGLVSSIVAERKFDMLMGKKKVNSGISFTYEKNELKDVSENMKEVSKYYNASPKHMEVYGNKAAAQFEDSLMGYSVDIAIYIKTAEVKNDIEKVKEISMPISSL